jgi:uroporphyrinogen-III synthase
MSHGIEPQVVITRPVGAGAGLARRIGRLGFEPVILPPVSLGLPGDAPQTRARLASRLAEADAVIAVSAAAVRFARRLSPTLKPPAATRGYGVGAASARALRALLDGTIEWPARRDSEGLLALPSLARVRGQRIVILAAPGGRGLIADTLRQRGANVEVLHVYRRRPARWSSLHRERLAGLRRPLVLLTSAESLATLLALAGEGRTRLLAGRAVVSSARLEAAARAAGFAAVIRAAGPDDDALAAACVAAGRT